MGYAKQTIVITKTTRKRKANNKKNNSVGKSKRCPKCGRYI